MRLLTSSISSTLTLLLALTTGLAAASPVCGQEPGRFRTAAIDLDLDLRYEREWLDGRARLTVENWGDRPAAEVPLMVGRLMRVEAVTDGRGDPLPFEQEVTVFEGWTLRQVNAARVTLPKPVAPGDSVRLTVRYAGHLVGATETGMRYVRDHLDPAFTVLRAEAFAFPVVGAPSVAAMRSRPRRAFRFSARVTVPDTLVVGTGGEVMERRVADGRATYEVRGRAPVPFLNLTVAPYQVHEHGGVRAYLLPGDATRAAVLLRTVDRALTWLEARYGPLPRPPELSLMEIPPGYGAQAHLDAGIMLEGATLETQRDRAHLYHEISHLWNAPDAEAPSPRWNEGLATYLQDRMSAELDGEDLLEPRAARASSVCERAAGRASVRETPLADYGREDMTGWSYSVGALLFHALYGLMGPEPFDDAYRDLYQSSRDGTVSVPRLEEAFVSADPRAAEVFSDWVHTPRWYERLCGVHDGDLERLVEAYR